MRSGSYHSKFTYTHLLSCHIARCPSLFLAAALSVRAAAAASRQSIISSSTNSSSGSGRSGSSTSRSSEESRAQPGAGISLRSQAAYYLLNPDGDLPDTQATFEPWLKDQLKLKVNLCTRCKEKHSSSQRD
jgi:hypothetical protein